MIKIFTPWFFECIISNSMKEQKRHLPLANIFREIFKFEKWVKYANEMTDDVIHSIIWGRSGTQYDAMVTELLSSYCGRTFSRILLQKIKNFWYKLAEISLFIISEQNVWLSVWRHHLANLHILKTRISLEQKEIFEKSKQHFSSLRSRLR